MPEVVTSPEIRDGFDYQLHDRSNYASPSPVISGKSVVFFYGNGDLISFDFKGKENWRRNIQKDYGDFCFQWTFSASPTFSKINFIYLFSKETNLFMEEGPITQNHFFYV